MSGMASLEAFISKVEKLRELNEESAKRAEKPVADVVRANIAAGRAPDGTKWPERREGGQALKAAEAALESSTNGNRVVLKIGPPYVYHHHGAGGTSTTKEAERSRQRSEKRREETGTKSKFHAPRRQILPLPGEPTPPKMNEAIAAAAKEVFAKAMGG